MLTLRTSTLPVLLICACVSPAVVGGSPVGTAGAGGTATTGPLGSTGDPIESESSGGTSSSGEIACDETSDTDCDLEPESDPCASVDSTLGCSFIVSPSINRARTGAGGEREEFDSVVVVNPSPESTAMVGVTFIPEGLLEETVLVDPVAVGPGQSVTFQVPHGPSLGSSGLRTGRFARVQSDRPVTASLHSPPRPFLGNDSALLLPDEVHGRVYVVPAYPPHPSAEESLIDRSFFNVVALEDGTNVAWHAQFSATLGNGLPVDPVVDGEWGQIVLNRFEVMRVMATDEGDLSGAVIEASSPVAVNAGTRCVTVPVSADPGVHCQPVSEQLLPVEQWDRQAIVPHPPLRADERHFVRVYAGGENVRFRTDPPLFEGEHQLPTAGSYLDLEVEHGVNVVVDGDGPLMAVGYLASQAEAGGVGGPAMVQYGSFNRSRDASHFSGLEGWDSQFVQIVRVADAENVLLDGEAVTGWEAFGSLERYGRFEVVTLPVGPGVHDLKGAAALATQFGWHRAVGDACSGLADDSQCNASYAHPVGWSF